MSNIIQFLLELLIIGFLLFVLLTLLVMAIFFFVGLGVRSEEYKETKKNILKKEDKCWCCGKALTEYSNRESLCYNCWITENCELGH